MCVGRAKKLRCVNTWSLIASDWIVGRSGKVSLGPKRGLVVGTLTAHGEGIRKTGRRDADSLQLDRHLFFIQLQAVGESAALKY